MKKVIGYIISILGLIILAVGAGDFSVPIISLFSETIVSIVALILIAGGVVLVVMFGDASRSGKYEGRRKSKRGGKIGDLPVYEGDNIVAYRRD